LRPHGNFRDTGRTWIEVDLTALAANARTIAARAGTARLLPMIKADAYGLGAVPVARALEPLDPWGYGVVTAEEGQELRSAGITRPIVVFSPVTAELAQIAAAGLTPVLGSVEQVRAWLGLVGSARAFHVQFDTGMCRSGIWWEAAGSVQAEFAAAPGFEGACTHFHSADSDPASVRRQLERFAAVLAALPRRPALVHVANSNAALRLGREVAFDAIRPGIFLYGGGAAGERPRPVVSWLARLVEVNRRPAGETVSYGATWSLAQPTVLATVSVGYADGLPRALGNSGAMLLGGRRRPIAGRVTMDLAMLDMGNDVPDLAAVATLIGRDGAEEITVDEVAEQLGTISYEILTGLGRRVRRVYA
jgi:alanine racemase